MYVEIQIESLIWGFSIYYFCLICTTKQDVKMAYLTFEGELCAGILNESWSLVIGREFQILDRKSQFTPVSSHHAKLS